MYSRVLSIMAIVLFCSVTDARPSARKLLYGGKPVTPGGNNGIGQGNSYQIPGQRNDLAAFATDDAIQKAATNGKAFFASAMGTQAALAAADRSVATRTFDKLNAQGKRKLQQLVGRRVPSFPCLHRWSDPTVASRPDRVLQSTEGRHLQQITRDERTMFSSQQISEQVLKATNADTARMTTAATAKGLAFAKLTTTMSARPSDFSP